RLSVVAGRGGDQAAPARLGVELGDQVDAAADLERTRREEVLVLHPDVGANQAAEVGIRTEGGRREVRPDPPPGGQDIPERGLPELDGHLRRRYLPWATARARPRGRRGRAPG